MTYLPKNKYFFLLAFSLLTSCVTSTYKSHKPTSLGTDIEVTPDRVVAECEFITDYEGDYKDPYGFMIHILDMSKTVLTVSNGTVLEKIDCFERLKASEKIIKEAKIVFVRGRGDAESPIKVREDINHFPKHGDFHWNGRALNFLAIWNDKGRCYDAFYGPEKPCPREKW
jgi:hypothetical protein